jgi:ATP-dependent Lhr-like helicase
MRGGPVLGEVEEWFVSTLEPGDNFIFAGQVVRYERLDPTAVIVSRGGEGEPRVPAYGGSRMPLTTFLAKRVREILSNPSNGAACRSPCGSGWRCSATAPSCRRRKAC